MASGLVENDKGIHSYKLKAPENASEGVRSCARHSTSALVGRSPTLEEWPAARASSLVLRSRGRLVDAQRLTNDKDFSVHVERLSSCFGRLTRALVGRSPTSSSLRVASGLS